MTIPSYEECISIVENSNAFIVKEENINNQEVAIFNYMLTTYKDFRDNNAFELRGLTFVRETLSGEWKPYPALTKFFNIGENESTLLDVLSEKRVESVNEKLDGSMITFIPFEDGSVRAKTKMSFHSEQAQMAQKIYDEDDDLKTFVNFQLENGLSPVFELTSPFNRIVVNYPKTELILLQVRNTQTGSYVSSEELNSFENHFNIKVRKPIDLWNKEKTVTENVDFIHNYVEDEDTCTFEGVIVRFDDGQMVKLKTKQYVHLHGLIENASHEGYVLTGILNDTIDDTITELEVDDPRRKFIEFAKEKVSEWVDDKVEFIFNILNSNTLERGEFVKRYKKLSEFTMMMKSWNTPNDKNEVFKSVVGSILNQQGEVKMKPAIEFLNSIGVNKQDFHVINE